MSKPTIEEDFTTVRGFCEGESCPEPSDAAPNQACRALDRIEAKLGELEAERDWFRAHRKHPADCKAESPSDCTCQLRALLEKPESAGTEEEPEKCPCGAICHLCSRPTEEDLFGPNPEGGPFPPVDKKPADEKCPDALLPDGEECPRCGGPRAPSGVGGGSWVHFDPALRGTVTTYKGGVKQDKKPDDEEAVKEWIQARRLSEARGDLFRVEMMLDALEAALGVPRADPVCDQGAVYILRTDLLAAIRGALDPADAE